MKRFVSYLEFLFWGEADPPKVYQSFVRLPSRKVTMNELQILLFFLNARRKLLGVVRSSLCKILERI